MKQGKGTAWVACAVFVTGEDLIKPDAPSTMVILKGTVERP
jgi:hypothetical protein